MFITNFNKVLLLVIVAVCACNPSPQKLLSESISKVLGPGTKAKVVVVIPNEGCEGCISEAELFVMENHKKFENVIYVFTKIHSVKLLKLRLGDSVISDSRVKLDINNDINYPERTKEIYPMMIYFESNEIRKIDYQSPKTEGFKSLLSYENF